MKQETKCYCGHTDYCDCGPLEEPKQKNMKQKVYVPVKTEEELPVESCKCGIIKNGEFDFSYFIKAPSYTVFDHVKSGLHHNQSEITHWLKEQEGYFFTPEQFNEYIELVIKKTLAKAAEKAMLIKPDRFGTCESSIAYTEEGEVYISSKSITNTFEEIFQSFKV